MSDDDDLHYEITVSDGNEAIGRFEVRGAVERDVLIAKWRDTCPLCAIDVRPVPRGAAGPS